MWRDAKRRADRDVIPFAITPEHVSIPEICPALGIPLFRCKWRACNNSPTLDRIFPHLGYVPGNIVVISNLANRIKSNASWEQVESVSHWLKGIIANPHH